MASLLIQHQEAVQRLAEVPGLGVASAQQIIAEVGAKAATFASQKHLSSWVGACPGDDESAGVSTSHRSPKCNRQMRRILTQCANTAVRTTMAKRRKPKRVRKENFCGWEDLIASLKCVRVVHVQGVVGTFPKMTKRTAKK
jgi:transposase